MSKGKEKEGKGQAKVQRREGKGTRDLHGVQTGDCDKNHEIKGCGDVMVSDDISTNSAPLSPWPGVSAKQLSHLF